MRRNDQKNDVFRTEKVVRISMMSNASEMMMVCQNSAIKIRILLGKVIIKRFSTQTLHGTGYILQTDHSVSEVSHLIDKDMVREPVSKMKNGKTAWQLGLMSEILKALGETGEASVIMYH